MKKHLDKSGFPQSKRDRIHCQNFINVMISGGSDYHFVVDPKGCKDKLNDDEILKKSKGKKPLA